jgi:exopolysaccharide biosynthesis polyprenyl glycosylphosphotransferase
MVIIASAYLIKGLDWIDSRAVMALFLVITFVSVWAFRVLIFRPAFEFLSRRGIYRRNVIVVGSDEAAVRAAGRLRLHDAQGFRVVGFVDDSAEPGTPMLDGLAVVGRTNDLPEIVEEFDADDVIIAQSTAGHTDLLRMIESARSSRASVRIASDLYRVIPEKVAVEHYAGIPVLLVSKRGNGPVMRMYKRVFDAVASALALLVLALPLAVIAILIKADSRGPVLFRDKRIGKGGREFLLYKFRTMYENSDDAIHREYVTDFIKREVPADGAVRKIVDDPRVTRLGRYLRRTSLDELPQLVNVLKGEMSLVGPRPCRRYEWEQYDQWHRRRMDTLPGCTGLWQVAGRSAVDFDDMVVMDLFYIESMSPLLDLKIMFRTLPVMFFGKGGH